MTRKLTHETDVCVIGGGMAGMAAALAAARGGASAILMHDRPVLGGNSSSECRVHITGADRHNQLVNLRETGILEELRLENLRRNPHSSFSVWDTVLYDAARRQDGLELMLNCSCCSAEVDGERIAAVTGWQTTTQTYRTVRAKVFIDTSGDGILAPLTGAAHRMGREGRDEYGESSAPQQADSRTMGMTCAFAAGEHDTPQPFTPPTWANRYDRCEDLPGKHTWWRWGYWWIELGGEQHAIHDTEEVRDELLATVYGVWDHVKNRCGAAGAAGADNWALEWVQFLPAKRESIRYVGKHVLTQNDIEAEGRFDDVVAYGGWQMDDHPPVGFGCAKVGLPPAVMTRTPSPYGIPYGSLVARDVANLMFAGRCASCSHVGMSSTRVMGTVAVMGQAAGTAAAMAVRSGIHPLGIADRIDALQQTLLTDDAYLPWVPQRFGPLTASADLKASSGDPARLRDGANRPVGDDEHAWKCRVGDTLEMHFPAEAKVDRLTLIADSALHEQVQMSWAAAHVLPRIGVPESMLKDARVEALSAGQWSPAADLRDNHQRLICLPIDRQAKALRITLETTWGANDTRLFAAYVD